MLCILLDTLESKWCDGCSANVFPQETTIQTVASAHWARSFHHMFIRSILFYFFSSFTPCLPSSTCNFKRSWGDKTKSRNNSLLLLQIRSGSQTEISFSQIILQLKIFLKCWRVFTWKATVYSTNDICSSLFNVFQKCQKWGMFAFYEITLLLNV